MRTRSGLSMAGLVATLTIMAIVALAHRDAEAALQSLYRTTPAAKSLAETAKGILVFPKIRKAGFVVGAQFGQGVLFENGRPAAHYRATAGSYGFQAGVQGFSYAMFFMTESALQYLEKSAGFEVGVGPSIVVVDAGKAKTLTTTTARSDVYAFIYGQKGLMAGMGLQGSKITRTSP